MKKLIVWYGILAGLGGGLLIGSGHPEYGLPLMGAIFLGMLVCVMSDVEL